MPVELTLEPLRQLVPRAQYDREPSYFIYGGLVFQTLTRDFLSTWDKWWNKAPKEFLYHYFSGTRSDERQEIVILTQVLADETNVGYDQFYNESIVAVNGRRPRDMADFVQMLDSARGLIELRTSGPGLLMLDAEQAHTANERIMSRYHIRRDRSLHLTAAVLAAAAAG
jgi:hypothetical protein